MSFFFLFYSQKNVFEVAFLFAHVETENFKYFPLQVMQFSADSKLEFDIDAVG